MVVSCTLCDADGSQEDQLQRKGHSSVMRCLMTLVDYTMISERAISLQSDAAFLPQLVDFDLNFLSQFLSDFFNFRFKKKAPIFLFNIHQLPTRNMAGPWSGCAAKSAVAVSR
jgi:hypothetical protein